MVRWRWGAGAGALALVCWRWGAGADALAKNHTFYVLCVRPLITQKGQLITQKGLTPNYDVVQ